MYPHETFHLRIGLLHHWSIHVVHKYRGERLAHRFRGAIQQENPLRISMKTIIRMLMHHIKQDSHANSQSDGQPTDVDDAVEFITEKIPNTDTQIVEDH